MERHAHNSQFILLALLMHPHPFSHYLIWLVITLPITSLPSLQGLIDGICIPYSPSMERWTLMNSLHGCPCCLQTTLGISLCAQVGGVSWPAYLFALAHGMYSEC